MRVIRYYEHGGPDVLTVEKAPDPVPGDGQLVVGVEAVGVNFIETQLRSGTAPFPSPVPRAPHGDVVGRVVWAGPGTHRFAVGDRLAAWGVDDAYADLVLVDETRAVPVPDDVPAPVATALASTAQVAASVLSVGRLAPGDTVLVHAAAGAIGHLVTQLARLRGAGLVIGTVSSPEKADFVREHGADAVVDYSRPDWPDRVREATGGTGVDLVLDSVEGAVFAPGLALLKPLGRLVYYGFAGASGEAGRVALTDLLGLKTVVGTALDAWLAAAPEEAANTQRELTELVGDGRLRVAVHAVLPLEEAARAHRLIEDRRQLGRVVLVP
ncbi:quinone oxidoreductase family protein [Actinoplanes derwentensis]|uniref:NADPH2:quinone reductase n=1 Tax=Actinoplanes derwentensis TaxID=113562 RepID=A0A1H2D850_9ACTN|nr:zinc-binding dehydrogenase [Actinoplanes derwentensis]GID89701.1 oxidoreductase [Actinoplanes derwentensis]SDT78901.1 NADPH2:quinone reductase [Actinoplanes derwentensis]